MPSIKFFSEDVSAKVNHPRKTSAWLKTVIRDERKALGEVNIILCSDNYLLELNQRYLQHNTFTDIITFDSSESIDSISGEIFISVDRIQENALKFGRPVTEEMNRVMVHGILHLIGYKDKSKSDKEEMRAKEDFYLSLSIVPRGTS